MAKGITLSEMIEQLRDELTLSKCKGTGQQIRFEPLEVTVETNVTVTRKGKGKAGLKFWVVDAGGELEAGTSRVQKIVLKLRPIAPGEKGGDVLLNG